METFLDILHVMVCLFLMLVVLLQQGKGGGMGAAFGGGAAQQVFGGRGAGNILTRATAICATIFILTSMGLAYLSRPDDASFHSFLAQRKAEQARGKGHEGEIKDSKSATPEESAAPSSSPSSTPPP